MKIIKHGKNVTELTITCPECGCEFIPLSTEILKDGKNRYVHCPECIPTCDNKIYISNVDTKVITRDELIEKIVSDIDVDRIHKVMTILDWKWSSVGHVPEKNEILDAARKIIKESFDKQTSIATGGFYADYLPADDENGEGVVIYFALDKIGLCVSKDNQKIEYLD